MVPFTCDFCEVGEVNLVGGGGKQEIVLPTKFVLSKSLRHMTPRFKFRCAECISKGINSTADGLTIHGSKIIVKAEAIREA